MTNCTLTENSTIDYRGAIYGGGGSATLRRCTVSGNVSSAIWGGISAISARLALNQCTLALGLTDELELRGVEQFPQRRVESREREHHEPHDIVSIE